MYIHDMSPVHEGTEYQTGDGVLAHLIACIPYVRVVNRIELRTFFFYFTLFLKCFHQYWETDMNKQSNVSVQRRQSWGVHNV